MKIIVPLVDVSELAPMIKAGADEFYFGLDLNKATNDANCLNVMAIDFANLRSIDDASRAVYLAHKWHKPVYMCINNEFYLENQYKMIFGLIRKIEGLDGVIVSDPALITSIAGIFPGLHITASTRANIFNSSCLKYFISLGVKRFVLPRHLYFKNMVDLIKTYGRHEFEIFIKNEDCPYINGFCSYTHNIWNDARGSQIFCRGDSWKRSNVIRSLKVNDSPERSRYLDNFEKRIFSMNCGVCSLAVLNKYDRGNIYLKLTSRLRNIDDKLKDIEFIKKSIQLLDEKINTDNNFSIGVKGLYGQIYNRKCKEKCYYEYR